METVLSIDEIFEQKYRDTPCLVNGFALPSEYANIKYKIDNFEIFESDIFVSSFSKTGTTWTQEMVWLIGNNVDFEAAKLELDLRCPFLEFEVFLGKMPNLDAHLADSVNFCKNFKHPRFMKTHLPYSLFFKNFKAKSKKPKVIYVTRNPKDVCCSLYPHMVRTEQFSGNFNEFCKIFLANKVIYSPYYNHIRDLVNHQNNINVLFLKFEDMKRNLVSVIKKVADFLEVHLTEDQVYKLNDHLSFESMRNNPYVNKEHEILNSKIHFMRSGKVGSYKEEMSEDTIKEFDAWINKNFKGLEDYVYF